MKYNKSEIMKNAWRLIKIRKLNRSNAMKYAWAVAKGLIGTINNGDVIACMTATQNIKTAAEKTLDGLRNASKSIASAHPEKAAETAKMLAQFESMMIDLVVPTFTTAYNNLTGESVGKINARTIKQINTHGVAATKVCKVFMDNLTAAIRENTGIINVW